MANLRKFQYMEDIGHLCAHYERSVAKGHYSNEDIDQDKLDDDRTNLAPDRNMKQTEYINEKISEIMGDRTLRKDAVRMACWVVNAPRTLPDEMHEEFFKETYNFLTDRYGKKSGMGEDVCISCYIHKSETTEHIHYAFLPVLERSSVDTATGTVTRTQSFCAKDLLNRDELKECQAELGEYLESKGICRKRDILNGQTRKDSNGRAYSVRELKEQSRNRSRNYSYGRGRF